MNILAARKYPNPRNGPLSLAEAETRRLAYAIKDPRSPSIDFDTAAREMARLIETPCWLVPILPEGHRPLPSPRIRLDTLARRPILSLK
jgi:hypothetical protein